MWNKRRTDQHLSLMSHRLSQLLTSGFPLLTALSLVEQTSPKRIVADLRSLKDCLQSGLPLSSGLRQLGYPPFFTFLMIAAEHHGRFSETLHHLSLYYRRRSERRRKQQKALVYPIFILLSSAFSFFLILYGLLPQFLSLYDTFSLQLPWMTRQLVWFSVAWKKGQWFAFGSIFPLAFAGKVWSKKYRLLAEQTLFRIPFLSPIIQSQITSLVALQTGLLLEGGVSILQICRLFVEDGHWQTVRNSFSRIHQDLMDGRKLSEAVSSLSVFLPIFQEVLAIAEEAGTLGVSLQQLGEQLEEEMDVRLEQYSSLLESAAIAGSGLIVMLLMLALFVPMFDFIKQL